MRSVLMALCLVGLVLGSWSCTDRDLGDEAMDDEPIEHPPELLERHAEACEDRCALRDSCRGYESRCYCLEEDFDSRHVLCLEKTILRIECEASLTCEQLDLDNTLPANDDLCYGQRAAEAGAC